jgi:hypothetical protein
MKLVKPFLFVIVVLALLMIGSYFLYRDSPLSIFFLGVMFLVVFIRILLTFSDAIKKQP